MCVEPVPRAVENKSHSHKYLNNRYELIDPIFYRLLHRIGQFEFIINHVYTFNNNTNVEDTDNTVVLFSFDRKFWIIFRHIIKNTVFFTKPTSGFLPPWYVVIVMQFFFNYWCFYSIIFMRQTQLIEWTDINFLIFFKTYFGGMH